MTAPDYPSLTSKAKLFRGLADPSRLALIEALEPGEKMVTELVALTGLSQPNASAHLACLKDCGLLTSRQEGRCVFYALADARMETLIEAAEGILFGISERVDSCSLGACQTARKCISGRTCASSFRIVPPTLRPTRLDIPLTATRARRVGR